MIPSTRCYTKIGLGDSASYGCKRKGLHACGAEPSILARISRQDPERHRRLASSRSLVPHPVGLTRYKLILGAICGLAVDVPVLSFCLGLIPMENYLMSSEKQKIIGQMLEMQKKFREQEKSGEIDSQNYWADEETHPARTYKDKYDQLANKLVDLAHEEKGSSR